MVRAVATVAEGETEVVPGFREGCGHSAPTNTPGSTKTPIVTGMWP